MSDLDDLIEAFASAKASTKIAAKEPLVDALNHVWQERVKKCRAELATLRSTAARVRNEALEEAAKVADARGWGPHIRDHSDSHAEGWRDCADEIAAKIRALQATSETCYPSPANPTHVHSKGSPPGQTEGQRPEPT